ncbi:bacteriorhodopsin [Aliterella atlantica]|uniref:Rhodopsin n=1 Tax=Aliterella atlantica CENA595 TaxID=1618023 RepID=A0A0D8ZW42_9CYAN|nr:microbial rhodopsin family protein [Aliterella atlantica]KJH72993.1 rhodopsin [Aliterella atlantica CENA595]
MGQIWLWIGVISMALGSVFFGVGAHNAKNERWRILFTLNFFICAIAAGLYLSMALGQGRSVIEGRPTVWVRYITWFLSTPLLLLDLTFLGKTSLPITASLIGANAYMIVTGFVATISADRTIGHIWYVVSCFAFLATVYLLVNQYRKEAERKHPRSKKVFRKLLAVHLVLWTLYPIVWLLGNTGLNAINQGVETMFYTLLDITSKVGFGFLSLNSMHNLEQAGEVQPVQGYESSAI